MYDGGGYVASLGYNIHLASSVVRDLKEHEWIDQSTAAVFIEFTLINPSTSLFSIARYTYERLPTGKVVPESDVTTLLLYPSPNANFQSIYEVCQLLFLIVIVICSIAEVVKFIRVKSYHRQKWNWVELLLLLTSVVAVAMSFLKGKYTALYVKKVQENPYETFSPDYIVRWSDQETVWLAATIFILTLKLLRLVRFNHHICQMQGTLKRSARPFISFVLVFAIGITAFSYFGCIAFSTHTYVFSSLYHSFKTNLLMSIGKQINYIEIYLTNGQIMPLFLFFYFLFITCMLVNVFIAVIVDSYTETREHHGDAFDDAKLGVFMFDNFSKKVKDFPGKVATGIKQFSKFRCTDMALRNKPYRLKLKRVRKRHQADSDANCGKGNEDHELAPLRKDDDLSGNVQEEMKTGYRGKETSITEIQDEIDEYYLLEIRKQLIDALTELRKYHVLIGRDSRAASVLSPK